MKTIYTLYVLTIIVLSLIPSSGIHTDLPLDKIGHFLAYCGLGMLSPATFRNRKSQVASIIFAVLLGISMEFIQIIIPSRTPSVIDEITNLAGLSVGILIFNKCPYIREPMLNVIDRMLINRSTTT